jgi:signal transduction histidine kinase
VPGLVHELRNAAFGFGGILEAFQARYPLGEEARYGDALRRQLERFTGFVEELGVYGEPGNGPRGILALDTLLADAAAACRPLAERMGAQVDAAWTGDRVYVEGDGAGLREAFGALARWALGQGGGRRALLQGGPGPCGRLEGPVVALAGLDLARIFEPFYFRGAGLGRLALPTARRVLEAHGGTLAAPAGPAGELTFVFALPAVERAP